MENVYELAAMTTYAGFPTEDIAERASRLQFNTVEEVELFIEVELLIDSVGDALPYKYRKLGAEHRRDAAIYMLKTTGRWPAGALNK